jgi:hypothetical protein
MADSQKLNAPGQALGKYASVIAATPKSGNSFLSPLLANSTVHPARSVLNEAVRVPSKRRV